MLVTIGLWVACLQTNINSMRRILIVKFVIRESITIAFPQRFKTIPAVELFVCLFMFYIVRRSLRITPGTFERFLFLTQPVVDILAFSASTILFLLVFFPSLRINAREFTCQQIRFVHNVFFTVCSHKVTVPCHLRGFVILALELSVCSVYDHIRMTHSCFSLLTFVSTVTFLSLWS
uniref:Uncharacterized protein n=1 Tax=Cacopsylla melanoneura TaxID=428564 RepID=A0A8D8X8R3_9HEMI